jgi:hypothetical protein
MKQENVKCDNRNDRTQQNIWNAETGINNKQLNYMSFDLFEFETKASTILRDGGIVSTIREEDYVVLLCFYNGFYIEMYADKVSYKLVYMQLASTFSLMKFVKKDLNRTKDSFLN